ncbi:hypothetical protein EJ02DRAFT_450518 [Clathrospora elynae]|uniref:Uncharacterized protein n=1 Tax=Clathrospora elynae TaxID=706981 RepID=A0A6A5T1I7_9PLEO|nr:hypothetical protein EJ02DRAFT_450518 [Clathrospora elynae]
MLTDRDPNGGGRTSRASNVSAMSRASGKNPYGVPKPDLLSSAGNGITSMLRTSTEMGNLGSLTGDITGMGSMRPPQRRGASSRLSTASSMSNNSSRASRHHHRAYPSSSSAPRYSMGRESNVPQYVADTLSPTMMNISGSSPLIPNRTRDRDSHRSQSMTHTIQPPYSLSSNRSLSSLRHEHVPRPKSPYMYHTRLRRPNYPPASPALSDTQGPHPRRSNGYDNQGQQYPHQGHPHSNPGQQHGIQGHPHNLGQMRLRIPSDISLDQQDRMHRMHSMHRRPSRTPSPAYYPGPRQDIPPMPTIPQQYHHRIAIEQARMPNRSAKGSVSSGSTNLRNDSDAPSSDMTSPPTPKDGTSMEVRHSLNGTHLIIDALPPNGVVITEEIVGGPQYYDYSEQFDRGHYNELDADPIPTGYVSRIKTIIEERGPNESTPREDGVEGHKLSVEVVPSEVANVAELPASPVARRITRDLILKGLEPVSTTGDVESSVKSPSHQGDSESSHSDHLPVGTGSATDELAEASSPPEERRDNRHSVLSQTGSSILDSSTLNFAIRHSIPMATGGGFGNDVAPEPGRDANSPASPERSTGDGMSELLAGYQHTGSKTETDDMSEGELTPKKRHLDEQTGGSTDKDLRPLPLATRSRSNHAQKPSDEQSFKSCTNLPEAASEPPSPRPDRDQSARSSRSAADIVSEREPSVKDSDARSFATAKITVSPERAASMPPSRLPSSNLGTMVLNQHRPASEVPLSKPPAAVLRKQPPVSRHESSFSIVSKLRTSSKPIMKHSSVSVSGSSSTLSVTQQPPVVPPRDSSTGNEAQRLKAMMSSLMRPRFTKGRKQADGEEPPKSDEMEQSGCDSTQETQSILGFNGAVGASQPALDVVRTPERELAKPDVIPPKARVISFEMQDRNPSKAAGPSATVAAHHHSCSSPSPVVYESSSVYSHQDNSSRSRVQSSPAGVPAPPEPNHRDSQTTTHLEWHRQALPAIGSGAHYVPSRPPSSSGMQLAPLPPLTNIQEDTTTNLRLSGYRYPGPSRYLPDLKEESHEDSSLNTSASNLKNSSFRFPFGRPPSGVRSSTEDPISFSQRSSMASHRRSAVGSALGQAHGLPSMRFSRMNLFDGLGDELSLRHSRSMEHVSHRLSEGSPPRPASAGDVSDLHRVSIVELDEAERSRGSTGPTTVMRLFAMHRARSPEVMAELEGLTIPSVGGLTQRFSEFFPSLREYYKKGEFPVEEEIEKQALDKIHDVHPTPKRSSARLRPMRGASHMIVVEDDVYEELTGKDKESDSPGRQGEGLTEVGASGMEADAKKVDEENNATNTQTRHTTSFTELEVPSPAVLRPRSHTVGDHNLRASVESALSSRRSLRSFVSSPTATETRPWNSDKNYPWAMSTNPSIDISLPPPTAARHSPRPGPSQLRNRLSDASTASSFSTAQTATASPFGSAPDSNSHARQHHFSSFGRNGDQAHAVGERYPTSALSPPTAIFRDHLSASDTDDDEDYSTSRKTRVSLRKRFSSTRKNTLDPITRVGRNKTNTQDIASPESTKQSAASLLQDRAGEAQAFTATTTSNRHTFRDAEGMRAADYHKDRILQRLKKWWHKGSNLIRQFSGRKRTESTTTTTA